MRIHTVLIAFFLGVWCLMPASGVEAAAVGDESLLASDRRIDIFAEKVSRDQERNLNVAEGAVEIRSGQMSLRADRVEINDQTMDLTATGNVVLQMGEDRLQGEYLELNLRTEVGYVLNGEGFSQAYYFKGERIDKLSEDTYRVRKGSITSCEGVIPDWSFKSPDTTIQVEHYIYTWHPTLWAKKVPVFYFPYAVFPIKKKRATGLLAPRLSYGNLDGWGIRNSFFWAPLDNADATFILDYFTRKGWGYGLESNYIFAEDTLGEFKGHTIRDRSVGIDRWEVDFKHRHSLPWAVSGLVNVHYLSDLHYRNEPGTDTEEPNVEKIDSFASLSREWKGDTLTLSTEVQQILVGRDRSTFTRMPELNFTKVESKIGKTPFFLSGTAQAVGLRHKREESVERTERLDLSPRLSLPLNVEAWLTVKPSIGLEYTLYSRDVNGDPAQRFTYNPRLEVTGPMFYRIFGSAPEGTRFKHIVTPRMTYNYRPTVTQGDLPRFDAIDFTAAENSVLYSLTNQVLGKFPVAGGEPSVREIMRLELSQKYDFDPLPQAEGQQLGGLKADFRALPHPNLSLRADAIYDFRESSFGQANYGFDWQVKEFGSLSLERRFKDPFIDYLEGSISVHPWRWQLAYRGRYDLNERMLVENRVDVTYAAKCWDATVTYIQREGMFEYRFQLNFKEIGTIIRF